MNTFLTQLTRIRFLCMLSVTLCGSAFASQPFVKSKSGANKIYPDKLIVKFKNIPDDETLLKIAPSLSNLDNPLIAKSQPFYPMGKTAHSKLNKSKTSSQLHKFYYYYLKENVSPIFAIRELSKNPEIEYVEPVFKHRINALPNDAFLISQEPYLNLIEAQSAWDVVKGESGNVVVAVIDGGTDISHPDLAANLWVNIDEIPENGIDDDNNGFVDDVHGWNFANNSGDPSGLASRPMSANHGTNTAGIICAVTDNRVGVAGLSWNAKLMAINTVDPEEGDGAIRDGYAGIIYAVENGADVINLSWGRDAPLSLFEQEIINYAASQGVAVIASAGNDGDDFLNYPASYPFVISVANTSIDDKKVNSSNYGRTVDITAPGQQIFSTLNDGNYGHLISGTSFSSPLVAGAVALVKTLRPDWLGIQAAEQVRVNSENIDSLNPPSFSGMLGFGRLNVNNAVTNFESPAIRIYDTAINDSDQNGVINPGERITLSINFINYLAPVASALVTLKSDDPNIDIVSGSDLILDLNTLALTSSPSEFVVDISAGTETGASIDFDLEISIGSYSDVDHFSLIVEAQHEELFANNIHTTVTGLGRIGFADIINQSQGSGFFHQSKISNNLLLEAAIIVGTSEERISNSARIIFQNDDYDQDFAMLDGEEIEVRSPGELSDEESIVRFDDQFSDTPVGVEITQETFASDTEDLKDQIIFKYTVKNQNVDTLKNFHFGAFFDWDVIDYRNNSAVYVPSHNFGYVFKDSTFVGTAALSGDSVSFSIFDNTGNILFNGFSDEEKWQAISSGVDSVLLNTDVTYVIGTGPFDIAPDDFIEIGFALIAGERESSLLAGVEVAQDWWNLNIITSVASSSGEQPEKYFLAQNYPNPFNPGTQILYQLKANEHASLVIYNLLGQRVRTLVDMKQQAGVHTVAWDGLNEVGSFVGSGVYIYRLQTESGFSQSQKMILLY